jgi:cobalt-zinc-cadmium efflux system membrane fusion protein
VDPGTHTVLVRSEVSDPQHALRSGMIATFTITIGAPMEAVAIPVNGVVREGDGTLTVWVAQDTHTFLRRSVRIGLQQDGFNEVLEGVAEGESVVTDGAILLSNLRDGGGADD